MDMPFRQMHNWFPSSLLVPSYFNDVPIVTSFYFRQSKHLIIRIIIRQKWQNNPPEPLIGIVRDRNTLQYIPRNMHTVFALLCFIVVIHWLIFPYPSGLLHWHCGNLTIAPVPAKQPWWIWINTSCEFIMNDCITTTKQSTTKPCAYFLGYTVHVIVMIGSTRVPTVYPMYMMTSWLRIFF